MNADNDLVQLFAGRDVGPSGDCPAPEVLWAATSGELDAGQLGSVLEHVAQCAACATDLAMARSISGEPHTETVVEAPIPGSNRTKQALWVGLALAASFTLAVLLQPAPQDTLRGVEQPVTPAQVEHQNREALTLTWESEPDAVFRVILSTEDLTPLRTWEGLTESSLQVPPALLVNLPPATVLLWRVEARRADGTPWTSPTHRVVVQ